MKITNVNQFLEATSELGQYFGVRNETLNALVSSDVNDILNLSELEQALVNQVFSLFDGSTPGGAYVASIQEEIKKLLNDTDPFTAQANKEILQRTIGIFHENADEDFTCPAKPIESLFNEGLEDDIREIVMQEDGDYNKPTKENPNIAAIQVFPSNLQFSGTNASRLQVFLNFIPTLEMSRCVPYFDMKVISNAAAVTEDGDADGLSQIKFLLPNPNGDIEGANKSIAGGIEVDIRDEDNNLDKESTKENPNINSTFLSKKVQRTVAGMELFTSPQTLVNADEDFFEPVVGSDQGNLSNSAIPILDKFRPFMTIKDFSVSVTPAYGAAGYKSAKLAMVLHDRSRLSQVAAFVQPDLYGNTELLIEWGWSHPDGQNGVDNPVGRFLNGLRRSEKFGIVNSSFTFTPDGQVDINLELFTKGAIDHESAMISESGTNNAMIELRKIVKQANEAYQKVTKGQLVKDVLGTTVIRAASSTSSALNMSAKSKKEISSFISKNRNSPTQSLKELADALYTLYGSDGTDGVVSENISTVKKVMENNIKILKNKKDPFASPFPMKGGASENFKNTIIPRGPGVPASGYVSLGKLLMTYVGKAYATKQKYNEVQFIFYCFNDKAGYFRHHNISQFPIKIEDLEDEFKASAGEDSDMSVNQFIGMINGNFIENRLYEPWGLRDVLGTVYEYVYEEEDGKKTDKKVIDENTGKPKIQIKPNAKDDDKADLNDRITQAIKGAYPVGSDVVMKMPKLEIRYDTAPALVPDSNGNYVQDDDATVLRIYVYDKQASPVSPQETLYSLVGDEPLVTNWSEGLETVGSEKLSGQFGNQEFSANHDKFLARQMSDAEKSGVIRAEQFCIKYESVDGQSTELPPPYNGKLYVVNGHLGRLREYLRSRSTSAIVGSEYSPIIAANLSSIHDPGLSTIKMKQFSNDTAGIVVGGSDYGIPTMIQPAELSIDMIGNPLMNFTEKIFIDFNTSTNADSYYYVNGIEHKLSNGSFKTNIKMIQDWSFEQFRSPASVIEKAAQRAIVGIKDVVVDGIGDPVDNCYVVKIKGVNQRTKVSSSGNPPPGKVAVRIRYANELYNAKIGYDENYKAAAPLQVGILMMEK